MLCNCILLKSLNLDMNYISEIQNNCFSRLQNLELLWLVFHNENLLDGYKYNQFANLKKIKYGFEL